MTGLSKTTITSLPRVYSGKVRESYAVGDDKLLIIATDRISAFDVILDDPIPGKGKVLTAITDFWFKKLDGVLPNHLTGIDPESVVAPEERDQVRGRAVVAMRLKPILVECVARGYLIGGGWKEYCQTGAVCGIKLPEGLRMGEKLPEPIFTPAGKAAVGTHDENITFERVVELYGEDIANKIRSATLELYRRASEYAATKGIIIADTKFEFGLDAEGNVRLMDEVLTPDSSRFWPAESYEVGMSPPSFDKQFIRDWLRHGHRIRSDSTKRGAVRPVSVLTCGRTFERRPDGRLPKIFPFSLISFSLRGFAMEHSAPLVGIVMGSNSDWEVMKNAADMLDLMGIPFEARVVSAHRMPDEMFEYAETARDRGLKVIIAGAGGAAHLPGMIAAKCTLPVCGVPVPSKYLRGVDSLHSIVQMPKGVPVATFAIGEAGAANAALYAAQILSVTDAAVAEKLAQFRRDQNAKARAMTLPR